MKALLDLQKFEFINYSKMKRSTFTFIVCLKLILVVFVLTSCNKETSPTTPTTPVIEVGASYEGGVIAYILPGYTNVILGIIVAPYDQGHPNNPAIYSVDWGCQGVNCHAYASSLQSGASNTEDIIYFCNESNIAARRCADLELNGYSDWHLPSKDELNKIYQNKSLIGGFANAIYWSSTEASVVNQNQVTYDSTRAWAQAFTNGYQFCEQKTNGPGYRVRAVRRFTIY